MCDYLNEPFDLESEALASAYDEVPYWSFHFGNLILDNVRLKPNTTALDIGFGTGYPLLELSQRLGKGSTVYGIDFWEAAAKRARFKAETLGIENVVFVDGDGADMSFEDEKFDLIVSNVGINNFKDPLTVYRECHRVAKPGAQVAFSTNPTGHMAEFYDVFQETLIRYDLMSVLAEAAAEEKHRDSAEEIGAELTRAGFTVSRILEGRFTWRFADGSAFFNHHVIKRVFVPAWAKIVPEEYRAQIFKKMEKIITKLAARFGEFHVTVPTAYIEAEK